MTLLDNLILLAAAALITGLLGPFVSARMNDRRVIQQRQAEEDLARDSKWRAYDESSFDELFALRAHVSRAQRLLTEQAEQQLAELHRWLFGDVDPVLTSMLERSRGTSG